MSETDTETQQQQFPCDQCGALLKFKPGTNSLVCPYCGFENELQTSGEEIEELDFHETLAALESGEEMNEFETIVCSTCGASMQRSTDVVSDECSFCGSTIVTSGGSTRQIKPKSLLPFAIQRNEGHQRFKNWVKKQWFAPGGFKQFANLDTKLNGVYIPYWTYDCNTTTRYIGQRGEYYYATVGSGKNTRKVRKIRWHPASGIAHNTFDDLIIYASEALPAKNTEKLEPWDVKNLVPYQDEYLSGFKAESYTIGLTEGFEQAKKKTEYPIWRTVRQNIGGDVQRISSMKISYDNITFKHILLPVWISVYRFKDKPYRVLVNARTGEVQGERPWSIIKITLAVLAALGVIGLIIFLIAQAL